MIIYFLAYYNVLWEVIKAQQPVGYLGCFEDDQGDSLVNGYYLYISDSNTGDKCKAGCKNVKRRYAGTMGQFCYCGNDVDLNRERNSTECDKNCPGNTSEQCGDYYSQENYAYLRITIYDTWPCITNPCQNGATCTDINAESYKCACTAGWIGLYCNVSDTLTTTVITSVSTTTKSAVKTTFNYTIFQSSSTQSMRNITPQPSENKLAIYIAVPVSIVIIIVFVLIVTVLILRKRKKRDQNIDGRSSICQSSLNTVNPLFGVARNAHNKNELIPLETPVKVHGTIDNNYSTIDKNSGSDLASVNVYDYGHLKVTSGALCDPTYSHLSGSCDTSDYTYSHVNQSVGKLNQEVMANVDHDTYYNTCNMNSYTEKLGPDMKIDDKDDTYNKLGLNGNTITVCEKNTLSSLNEPDYDHTDVKNQ